MNVEPGTLLDGAFLAELEALQLRSRHRLVGALAGDHRSVRRGSSLDFADTREYHPGDDYRRIDYHLLARLDQLVIKLYDADDDTHTRLVIDTSASMAVGAKLLQASRVAAALGFVTLVRRDSVSVHTFAGTTDHAARAAPRFVGRSSVRPFFRHLCSLEAGGGTDMVDAVRELLSRPGPRGVTVLVSDLMTKQWPSALRRLPGLGGDLVVVHLLAKEDMFPEALGELDLVDSETGRQVRVSLSPAVAERYTARVSAWSDEVSARCRHLGLGYLPLRADADLRATLRTSWRAAGLLR